MSTNQSNIRFNTEGGLSKRVGSIWDDELPLGYGHADLPFPEVEARCQCGAAKVYGETSAPEFHSHWCPVIPAGKDSK